MKDDTTSLPEALGFSGDRADEILEAVRTETRNSGDHSESLLRLNDKFDDNELLFAAYAYGRVTQGMSRAAQMEIVSDLKKLLESIRHQVEEKK